MNDINQPESIDPQELISWIREHGKGTTPWEDDFLNDIETHLECEGTLSFKQEETLNKIFDQRVGGRR